MSTPFGPGVPVDGVLGAPAAPPTDDRTPGGEQAAPASAPDDVAVASASNRRGTVTVTATDRGQPLDLRVDQRELRYGGAELAAAILEMCRSAAAEAKARRRDDLAGAGVPPDILDRLGLPTRDAMASVQDRDAADGPVPPTWLRPL
ncbi:hypothetical protein ACFWPA_08970 [Rhodococcus sp. NPDC058505]|uniref:hypothetical protein n=1 Tax=unclassified Rhodococcus (in: high G+C Gram-positive bacteria) TaxID=192944 RepID=UPI00364A760A